MAWIIIILKREVRLLKCIYADVLVITNIYFTYFFIKILSLIFHINTKAKRVALASVAGGLSALLILLPINDYIITILKLAAVFVVMFICGVSKDKYDLIKYSLTFILINIIFTGLCFAFWKLSGGKMIYVKNFTVYFDMSLIMLIIITILVYFIMTIADYFLIHRRNLSGLYTVTFNLFNKDYSFKGIVDTGNDLYDYFSGRSVIICKSNELVGLYNELLNQNVNIGFRLIPFATISGDSLIPIKSMQGIKITDENGNFKEVRACIGITKNESSESQAIFNPSILS